ncbi:hypothetical protein [Nocardia alni]|uniref:hypothetical protein n=1 Tax=Nocardia alni TaxID=2815723 RepID=UPI001C20FDCC|nr:hypothetical protein [Nocardia alni]
MYDALVSADIVTDDPDGAADRLVALFDLPVPRPSAYQEPDGHGFRAVWLRVAPSMSAAPTRIELIGPRPRVLPHDYVEERVVAQGDRPIRTHATVLAGDVEAVLGHLRRAGVRHRITPASEDFDFPRVWLGVSADDPTGYRQQTDAGLWLEVVPTASSGLSAGGAPRPAEGPGVRRIRARRFIVDDAVRSVRALAENLALEAASLRRTEGGTIARYVFGNPYSAALELCEPAAGSELDAFGRTWGPGPHAIVLEVGSLEAMAAALTARGVPVRRSHDADGLPILLPDPARTLGVPFELVEEQAG